MASCSTTPKAVREAAQAFPGVHVLQNLVQQMFLHSMKSLPSGCGHDHSLLTSHAMMTVGVNLTTNSLYQYSLAVDDDPAKREAMHDTLLAAITRIIGEIEPMHSDDEVHACIDKLREPMAKAQRHMLNSYLGSDASLN